jgi:outer membrane protein assembly factor BamB
VVACGVRQYIQLTGWGVISVRAEDGTPLWVYERAANELANITTPVVRGNYVFCSSAYQTGAALLELKPNGDGVRAEEVYFLDHKTLQNHHGGTVCSFITSLVLRLRESSECQPPDFPSGLRGL